MAWGSQMQKTYYGDNYWVPTWTVCTVRCGLRQRKPIHISRFQGVLQNLRNKAHNHTAISPKTKRQGELFVETLTWALKNALGTPTDKVLQQFLLVYRIPLNPNTPLAVSPAETMFARKIRSVFDKLLPKQNKLRKTTLTPKNGSTQEKRIILKNIKITRPVGNVE